MSKSYRPFSAKTVQTVGTVLTTIDGVIDLCKAAEMDPAVDHEIAQLESLKPRIQKQWPLPRDLKASIDLGPFAAKNIADWNPALADTLMRLDYAIQHDGASIDDVIHASEVPHAQILIDA